MRRAFVDLVGRDFEARDIPVAKIAVALVREGYAVIPVQPGSRKPLCPLRPADRRKADRESRTGRHDCSVHHAAGGALLDREGREREAGKVRRVFERLAKGYGAHQVNLGVVAHPSRLITVDCDTAKQLAAYITDMARETGDPGWLAETPHVRTPGEQSADGSWRHSEGGHFHYNVPAGVELPVTPGTLVAEGGYEIRWGMSQALVPPSIRPEGRYLATGDIHDAPDPLLKMITRRVESFEAYRSRVITGDDAIAQWSLQVTWTELMIRYGWSDTSKADRCGCPIFTRPGEPVHPKSATGHLDDCVYEGWQKAEGHAPLHCWTTDLPDELAALGKSTITKLEFVAAMEFGGDVQAAMVGLGITPAVIDWATALPEFAPGSEEHAQEEEEEEGEKKDPWEDFFRPSEPEEFRKRVKARCREEQIRIRANELRSYVVNGPSTRMVVKSATDITARPPVPSIGHRVDGVPLLYPGRVNTIWGPSASGKSWFSIACALDVTARGGRALIIDTEDDESGFRHRTDLLGGTCAELRYIRLWAAPDQTEADALLAEARRADLVVIDSLDGFLALYAVDSNAATDVRSAGATMKRWAQAGNAAVLVVDHSTEKVGRGERANSALGSSAKKQLIDGVMLRADKETRWGPRQECKTMIMIGKDRHAGFDVHAEFNPADPDDLWGRAARLHMVPEAGESPLALTLEKPPNFFELPAVTVSLAVQVEKKRILEDFFDEHPNVWHTRTKVMIQAGDKDNAHGTGLVLDGLVAEGDVQEGLRRGARGRPAHVYGIGEALPDLGAEDPPGN